MSSCTASIASASIGRCSAATSPSADCGRASTRSSTDSRRSFTTSPKMTRARYSTPMTGASIASTTCDRKLARAAPTDGTRRVRQMHRSMWTYAWDLLDLGIDATLQELRDRAGLNSVSLASSYHAGRFLQPRSPRRKAYFPEDGTIYFRPDPARWEGLAIQPKVADIIVEGGDVLDELVRRRDAGGLRVSCWTVCLHNTRLGMLHPGVVTRNAFGDPNYYNLCPSHPDARAYVCALVEDVTKTYKPDVIEL